MSLLLFWSPRAATGVYTYDGEIACQSSVTALVVALVEPVTAIAAQSTVSSPVSFTAVPDAVIAAQFGVVSPYSFTHEFVTAGEIAAQSTVESAYSFTPSNTIELIARPGIILTTGQAGLTYTPVARPDTGGGGMAWPTPQRVRRVRPRERVPVLVHRTIVARPARVRVHGSVCAFYFRRSIVAGPGTVTVRGGAVTGTLVRAIVAARPAGRQPVPAVRGTFQRTILARPVMVLSRASGTVQYQSGVMAQVGRVLTSGAPATLTISKHPRYETMFADEEWLLMEVA